MKEPALSNKGLDYHNELISCLEKMIMDRLFSFAVVDLEKEHVLEAFLWGCCQFSEEEHDPNQNY